MSRASKPITVALLALPATTAATLYGFHDSLASMRRDWASDSSFFSRLFKRKVGMTPVQYRQRFGRLARELQGLASPPR